MAERLRPALEKLALVVPGGVDRSGERRVIPALLALIARLARERELHVFALAQESQPARWQLEGATIHNIGSTRAVLRTVNAIRREHRVAPFGAIQSIWAGASGVCATLAGRVLGLPVCVHLAGGELEAVERIDYGAELHWHWRRLNRFTLRRAARISAASRPMVERAAQLGLQARRIALGVDLERWPPRAPAARAPGSRARLVHVASLNRVKDQPTLLAAAARLAARGCDFELDILGEDTLGGEMQALARQLRLEDRVRFHGVRTQRELRPVVEAAHLHIVSSLHEAGPMVLLEAAVAGLPTVGTAVGHLVEWAPDAAVTVAGGDSDALAAAIESLLADEPRRLAMARAAQARAIAEDADWTARQFLAQYAELR